MRIMNYKLLLFAIISITQIYAAEQPKRDLFDKLSQQAEEQYRKSNDQAECNKTAEIKIEPMTCDNLTTTQRQQLQNIIVPKSIFFSSYSCRKLLKANPIWQQIKKEMPQDEKNRLFGTLLSIYNSSGSINNTFSLACAVCAGANPNQEPNGYNESQWWGEHQALWLACSKEHKAFFYFLIEQGADLDLPCHGTSGRKCAKYNKWLLPLTREPMGGGF